MTAQTKTVILKALDQYRGDNFERASAAFRGKSPDQMKQLYGQSGETCQQILDGYKQHVDAIEAAIIEVNR